MQHKDTQYVHLHPYLLYIDIIFKLEDNLKIRWVGAPLSLGAGYQHKYMFFKQPTICTRWKLIFWWRARQKAATISIYKRKMTAPTRVAGAPEAGAARGGSPRGLVPSPGPPAPTEGRASTGEGPHKQPRLSAPAITRQNT